MFKQEIVKKEGYIYFTGNYLELYVPKEFIDKGIAEDVGNSYNVFGLLHLKTFDSKGNPGLLETLNLPTMITTYPSDKEERNMVLGNNESRYLVLKFYKGDKIMNSQGRKDSINCEIFMKDLLLAGKLPSTIDYSKIKPLWDKNLSMNGVSFGVPSATMSVIISEVYRCKEKPELKYAKVVGKNFTKVQLDYITSNIRQICARNSTFAALTFEDFDAMLTASLNIKNYNRRESISPVEKIIKM